MAGSVLRLPGPVDPMAAENATGGSIRSVRASFRFEELDADPFSLRERVGRDAAVELCTRDAVVVVAAFRALEGFAAQVSLQSGDGAAERRESSSMLSESCLPSSLSVSDAAGGIAGSTRWVLHTSGTSGTPRAITHTLSSLTGLHQRERTVLPRTWGLLYEPTRMAGVQVLLHALGTGASVVATDPDAPLADRIGFLRMHETDALSATPTLWRRILQVPVAAGWELTQVTVGGEIADQVVLDALKRAFPSARITHVFAATESGTAFSVSDGRAGFPVDLLEATRTGTRIDVRDSVLHVHNPESSAAGADGFVCTGDVVKVKDGRVFFLGRNTGVVNVGGQNVWPEQVEKVLREHPEIEDARVTAQPSSLAGNVLIADVVSGGGVTAGQLRAWVRERTPISHVPARICFVDELATGVTGKALR